MRFILILVYTLTLALSTTVSAQKPTIIKFSHVTADNTPKGQGALKFKELAEKKLFGKVEVQVFPNSQLFADSQEMDALLLGDIHILAPSLSKFDRYTKKLQIFDLPFLFNDLDAVNRFQDSQVGRELLGAMHGKGIQGLGYWLNGMKQLSTNRPRLQRPEDIKGLKIRVQDSDVLQAQFRALGANPQKMAFSEVYQALQTGVVDGQENTWSNIFTQKFFEVQKSITETNHGAILYMVITNSDWWDSLPADIRTGLAEAMDEATSYANKLAYEINEHDREQVIAAGKATVHTLSPEDLTVWRKLMEPLWKKYEADIGKDLIDAALQSNN